MSSTSGGRNLIPYVLGGVVVLAVLALIVVSVSGSDDGADQTAPVEVAGTPLPPYGEGGDAAVGAPIPEAFGTSFDDSEVQIVADGTPKAIAFLAHWCSHCQAEVSEITSFLDGGGTFPEGVEIVTVSTSVDSVKGNFPASTWLEDEGWPYPVMRDDDNGKVSVAYGMAGTPFWVFVDADGNVAERVSGQQGSSSIVAAMERIAPGASAGAAEAEAADGATEADTEAPAE